MKKVRLSLPRGVRSWSLVLYDSPESAYLLKDDVENIVEVDEVYRRVVTLKRGEFLEVEWMGAEWVYGDDPDTIESPTENATFEKFDRIRFVKSKSSRTASESTHYLETHSGWVITGTIPWYDTIPCTSLKITEIKGGNKPKIDFSLIFQSEEEYEEDDNQREERSSTDSTYIN